jgi:hypothetical protein
LLRRARSRLRGLESRTASIDRADSYNCAVATERPQIDEGELDAIVHRLRQEVRATQAAGVDRPPVDLPARRELDRLWAVTAERPYLYRPGRWGRVRGMALVPLKAVTRRLMRWYVEPVATDQRAFNAALLRLTDELVERLVRVERSVNSLEKRIAQLEPGTDEAPSRGR